MRKFGKLLLICLYGTCAYVLFLAFHNNISIRIRYQADTSEEDPQENHITTPKSYLSAKKSKKFSPWNESYFYKTIIKIIRGVFVTMVSLHNRMYRHNLMHSTSCSTWSGKRVMNYICNVIIHDANQWLVEYPLALSYKCHLSVDVLN